jgi:hypothetical protein
MISDGLQQEIAAAVRGTSGGIHAPGLCVLGVEAINNERWRAWLSPHGSAGVFLLAAALRSNCAGRTFDLHVCLWIASWRMLPAGSASVFNHIEQLVSAFEHLPARGGRRACREIPVAGLPLSFCDSWDRLWVVEGLTSTRTTAIAAKRRLIWQHGDALFLATGWHSALSPALAERETPRSATSLPSLHRAKKHERRPTHKDESL